MGRRKWSRADIYRLFELRDVQKLKWREIGEAFGAPASVCCTRYQYYKNGGASSGPPAVVPVGAAKSDAPIKPARAAEIVHRPRYFHEADADIAARISRQGLTAGFLGDPPPGRSALDQKQLAP